MTPARPAARGGRNLVARVQATLYRHRWIRWAAAIGAAVIVMVALSGGADPEVVPAAPEPSGPANRLPPGTRGVPVPVDSAAFAVGDSVDVHAVLDGAAVVRAALVVEARGGQDGVIADEVVVAVPAERVDATVDALTTGGVILVLVPHPAAPEPAPTLAPDPELTPP